MRQGWGRIGPTHNNTGLLSDISAGTGGLILNIGGLERRFGLMKRLIAITGLAALVAFAGLPAMAECYADYKAKRDDPLRLHYGVIALSDPACANTDAAGAEISRRIAMDGWTLLKVVSIFDATGLNDETRKESAGDYFLRY